MTVMGKIYIMFLIQKIDSMLSILKGECKMNKKLIALCATGLLMASAVTVHAEDTMHTIYTTGTAKITIPADMATFQVTVDSRADNASAASSANAMTMAKVRRAVIAAGANVSRLETTGYSVSPEYRYEKNGKSVLTGYRAHNVLKVQVDNVRITGKVMDAAVDAGASYVDSVSFGLKDPAMYQDRALAIATKSALRKATVMAQAVGKRVISTVSLYDQSNNEEPTVQYRTMKLAAADNAAVRQETSLEPTEQEITASVGATFQIN